MAVDALGRLTDPQQDALRRRVAELEHEAWATTLARVPKALMSQVDRRFAAEVIHRNRKERLDAL